MFLFTLLCLLSNISFSQLPAKTEELLELFDKENDDSLRAEILNEISWQYKDEQPELGLKYGFQALEIAVGNNLSGVEATSLNRIGNIERLIGRWDEAVEHFVRALKIERKRQYPYGIGRALGQLTLLETNLGNYNEALNYGIECIKVFESIKSRPKSEANALQRLAKVYYEKGDYDKSISYNERALEKAEEINYQHLTATCHSLLAEIYSLLGLYQKSINYHKLSLEYWKRTKNYKEQAKELMNIGVVYIKKDSLSLAETLINESLRMKENRKLSNTDSNFNNLALISEKRGQYKEAFDFYKKSLDLKLKTKDNRAIAIGYFNLGNIYRLMQNELKALENLKQGLAYAEESGYPSLLLKLYWELANIYLESEENEEATRYINLYQDVRNNNNSTIKFTNQLVDKYEQEKNNNALLAKDNTIKKGQILQQNTIIVSLCLLLIFLIGLFFFGFRNYRLRKDKEIAIKNKEISEQRVKDVLQKQELAAFTTMVEVQEKERNRIARDLHDRLGGMLSMVKLHFKSVEDEIKKLQEKNVNQYEKANSLLDEACDEVRKVAHDMTSGVLMNFGLIPALNDLKTRVESTGQMKIELVDIGLENRLAFDYEINIYRIIQELLSNALRHSEASEITIQLFKKNNSLNILVEDNGVGFDSDKTSNNRGMGLDNIQKRIDKFEGEMSIDSGKGGGTTISIDITINQKEKDNDKSPDSR